MEEKPNWVQRHIQGWKDFKGIKAQTLPSVNDRTSFYCDFGRLTRALEGKIPSLLKDPTYRLCKEEGDQAFRQNQLVLENRDYPGYDLGREVKSIRKAAKHLEPLIEALDEQGQLNFEIIQHIETVARGLHEHFGIEPSYLRHGHGR